MKKRKKTVTWRKDEGRKGKQRRKGEVKEGKRRKGKQ